MIPVINFFTLSSILASRGAANYWYFRPKVPRGKTCWEPLGLRLYLSNPSNANLTLYLRNVCYRWWSFKFLSAYLRYTLFYYIANYYWQARIKVKFQHEDKIYFLQKSQKIKHFFEEMNIFWHYLWFFNPCWQTNIF